MKKDMKKWMFEILNSRERYAMPIMTYPGLALVQKGNNGRHNGWAGTI